MMRRISIILFIICISMIITCEGGSGGNNSSANYSVAAAVKNTAPASTCPYGGITVETGIDSNGNGILDPSEVQNIQYVCNGAPGENGNTALVSIKPEPKGSNCAEGGQKICSGLDKNVNNSLDDSEITSTEYLCNGAQGTPGPGITWVDVTGTSVQATPNSGYIADSNSLVTITLPSSLTKGDIIQVNGVGAGGWKIAQNAGQSIETKNLTDSIGAVWTQRATIQNWTSVASSSDGSILTASTANKIITSNDYGKSWIRNTIPENDNAQTIVASSSDGRIILATAYDGQIYISKNFDQIWAPCATTRKWNSITSSSDGSKLVAVVDGGYIYTSSSKLKTTTGTSGSIRGGQFDAIELQYIGNNTFTIISHEGNLQVE
jgi:hypothetical protein